MAAALPPLRSDLIIEAVAPTKGDPAYDVSSPDLTRTHRVTSQAYLALSMIDGRKDFKGWAAAVQQMYPELNVGQLHHLAQEVNQLGYFLGAAVLPPAPGPVTQPLIADLATSVLSPSGGIAYDPQAATLPGAMLSPHGADATALSGPPSIIPGAPIAAEMSPEQAMEAMFSGGGLDMLNSGAPRPVTAVNEPNPLLMGSPGPDLPAIDDESISMDVDVEMDFPSEPSVPLSVGGAAPGQWTAPPTPVPVLPGQPLGGQRSLSPPAMPLTQPHTAKVEPHAGADPLFPANTDEFPPMVVSLPSGEGRGDMPRAWPNLVVESTDSKDLVAVTGPQKGLPFQIYELEHRMLQLMDGTKTLPELLEAVRKMGHPIDEGQLTSFVRQMDAYGFLESTGPLERKIEKERMWAPKPPDQTLSHNPWPEEERRLFQVGLGHFRDGKTEKAISFFEALLEVNPDNPEARSMLELIRGGAPTVSALDQPRDQASGGGVHNLAGGLGGMDLGSGLDGFGEIGDEGPPLKKKRGLFRPLAAVVVLVAAAAVGGMYVEQPEVRSAEAKVMGGEATAIVAPADGIVIEVLTQPGRILKVGDPVLKLRTGGGDGAQLLRTEVETLQVTLAELPPRPLNGKAIRTALRAKRKALSKLQKRAAKIDAALAKASKRKAKSLKRKKKALAPKLSAVRNEVEALEQKKEAAANALAPKELAALKSSLEAKKAQLAEATSTASTEVVTATAAGVVAQTPALPSKGAPVKKGQPLTSIGGDRPSLQLFVPQDASDWVKKDLKFQTVFSHQPETPYPCTVLEVGSQLEERGTVTGVIVSAQIDSGFQTLKPNMTGDAALEGEVKPLTLILVERARRFIEAQLGSL